MTNDFIIYEFAGLKFSPFDALLENTATSKKIKLTQTHCHLLLAIVQKSPEIISYDELRRKVWVQYAEMSESLLHNIHVTKRGLVKVLKDENFPSNFIKTKAAKGYQLTVTVSIVSENQNETEDFAEFQKTQFQPEISFADSSEKVETFEKKKSGALFKTISALFYGSLFALGLLLEIAYQFDRYGVTAVKILLPLMFWNSAIMFAALSFAEKTLLENKRTAFLSGVSLLIGGAVVSCMAMAFFLPFEAITAARFQTQPAFAAFLKNVLIYFLPLGVFCVFTPFFLVRHSYKQILQTILPNLFGLLFLALIYSLFSTFYLLDNLLPSEFHGLFVTLAFLRFIIYFGLGAACLLWTKAELKNDWTEVFSFAKQWKFAAVFALVGIGLILIMAANRQYKTPFLESAIIKTLPDSERRFFINLRGAYFDAETVCVRVVGAECLKSAPCLVPNGALKKHSIIADNQLENVPLTLPAGKFQIFAQNGDSLLSNFLVLNVP